jgi:hypothetical protein
MGRKHPTGSWNNTGGAIPEEYQRVPAPVFVVNSDRRSEDVDDEGKQKRRAPGSSDLEAHQWRCWDGDGAGAKLRTEVRAIKSRIAWYNGGTATLSAIGLVILAAWLSSKFAANERNAVKRADVESAIQRSAESAENKRYDDLRFLKQDLIESAAKLVAPARAKP